MGKLNLEKSGGQGRWATVLEMPIDPGGQYLAVKKAVAERLASRHAHCKHLGVQSGGRKAEKTNGAVNRSVFVGMEVGLARACIVAMRQLLMVVVAEQEVGLFLHHDLKDQQRQQQGGDLAVC